MSTTALRTKRPLLTVLALGLATLGPAGCDRDGFGAGEVALRPGSGTGGTTFNTDNWVSPAGRDVYEFDRTGAWRTNAFGFDTRLKKVIFDHPGLGRISTDPSSTPNPLAARVELSAGPDLELTVYRPGQTTQKFGGDQLVGLELLFNVKFAGSSSYNVKLRIAQHHLDPFGGDFYEFLKVDPSSGDVIAPICETSTNGDRGARVYGNTSVDAITGAVVEPTNVFHIGCTAGAPGKSSLYGYFPTGAPDTFRLVNRVIRADYCADGYPFTFPGNSLLIRDNISPDQVGQTLADATAYAAANGAVLEAMWDVYGIMCVNTPRVDTLDRGDVVCPVKRMPDGTTQYNWQPPPCDGFVDADPGALRIFSLTQI